MLALKIEKLTTPIKKEWRLSTKNFLKKPNFSQKSSKGAEIGLQAQNWCPCHKTEKIYFSLKKRIGRLPPKKWVPGSNLKMVFRKKVGPRQGMKPAQP